MAATVIKFYLSTLLEVNTVPKSTNQISRKIPNMFCPVLRSPGYLLQYICRESWFRDSIDCNCNNL